MNEWHETEIRVRYAETDQMGIVHHANYPIWFEAGRTDLCRAKGFSYKQMEEEGNALIVVAEIYCRFKSPAFYDDVLTIRTQVEEVRSRSLRFIYQVYRASDHAILCEGQTLHIVTDKNKKVRTMPEIYRNRLLQTSELSFPLDQAPS